jgi:hypothetical protein
VRGKFNENAARAYGDYLPDGIREVFSIPGFFRNACMIGIFLFKEKKIE